MSLSNPVVLSVLTVLLMCLLRINVVIALTTGALVGGLAGGLSFSRAMEIFSNGLADGAKIALSYAILGAFASALAHSGLPNFLIGKMSKFPNRDAWSGGEFGGREGCGMRIKLFLFSAIGAMSVACKNVIPVHIAFIPILIPPLLGIFNRLNVDRRAIACIITFGVIAAYLVIPVGCGEIFLVSILSNYLRINGLEIGLGDTIAALSWIVVAMGIGLAVALVRYGRERRYEDVGVKKSEGDKPCSPRSVIISCAAVVAALVSQIICKNIIVSALAGFLFLSVGRVVSREDSDNVVANGFKMMAVISFTMMAAAGFSNVLRESGGITEIVDWLASHTLHSRAFASFSMLLVGFLISIGIGSSFSTVPIVASVYVPLGLKLGFSPAAIAVLIAVSGVTGDAGSPASDSTLGPTMGLNADGQHSLVRDTAIPTFLHLTIPAFICGWIASLIL